MPVAQLIAVVGLDQLAAALRTAGLEVVSGRLQDAAGAVRTSGEREVAVIVDCGLPGAGPWATAQGLAGRRVVWISSNQPAPAGCRGVALPAPLEDIFEPLGVPVPQQLAGSLVLMDGSLAGSPPSGASSSLEALWGPGPHQEPQEPSAPSSDPLEALWGPGPHQEPQEPAPRAMAVEGDLDLLWGPQVPGRRRSSQAPGRVVALVSTAGGAGVSSLSLSLAQKAAERLERVAVLDVTGDLRELLMVPEGKLPWFGDYLLQGSAKAAIAVPQAISSVRPQLSEPVRFGAILGPVTKDCLRIAQELSTEDDLIVVDAGRTGTSPCELPQLLALPGAVGVGVVDDGPIALPRLFRWWSDNSSVLAGSHWVVIQNRCSGRDKTSLDRMRQAISGFGAEIASPVYEDGDVRSALNAGVFPVGLLGKAAEELLGVVLRQPA